MGTRLRCARRGLERPCTGDDAVSGGLDEQAGGRGGDLTIVRAAWPLARRRCQHAARPLGRLPSHSAGINVSGFAGYDRDAPLPTLLQVLDGTRPANNEPITVTSVPGSAPSSAGGGTTVAQQLAVDVSGEAFPIFMQHTILGPLGMKDSTLEQ